VGDYGQILPQLLTAPLGAPPSFWAENKDLLALLVSLAALAISTVLGIVSLRITRRAATQNLATSQKIAEDAATHNRKLARDATYQRIHELLVDPKAAAGRRALFQAHKKHRYPAVGRRGWDEINYSLALYDTLAGYVSRDQIDEDVVLKAWHHPLDNIAEPVREFMAHRREQNVNQPWAHLIELLRKAQRYDCRCPIDDENR